MFDVVLKITKHRLSDEHSSQLGAINAGQAIIMAWVINLIGNFFDVAEAKKVNQPFTNKEIMFFSTNFSVFKSICIFF